MTYEMMQDIASEVINEAEFVPGVKLFDLDPDEYFDEYCVADSDSGGNTMPLREFLTEYTNKLLKTIETMSDYEDALVWIKKISKYGEYINGNRKWSNDADKFIPLLEEVIEKAKIYDDK